MTDKVAVEIQLDFSRMRRVVGHDEEGEPIEEPMTMEDAVVDAAARQVLASAKSDVRELVREAARKQIGESIRAIIEPLIVEALTSSIQPMNSYGEAKGEPVTLREVIVKKATEEFRVPSSRNGSYHPDKATLIEAVIREEVSKALKRDLVDAIAEARKQVLAAVQEKGAEVIAETITKMAGVR